MAFTLSDLKRLIVETLEEEVIQDNVDEPMKFEGKNDIKDFYVVSKPTNQNHESMVRKCNVFDEVLMEGTHGIYASQAEATREAKSLTQDRQSQLKELESTMEEVRAQQAELKARRDEAKAKLDDMKGKKKK